MTFNAYSHELMMAESDSLGVRHVLDALDDALANVLGRVRAKPRSYPSDPEELKAALRSAALDQLVEEMGAKEHLLGAAFVVCQGSIGQTIARLRALHDEAEYAGGP